jgi:hypothetical protein
VPSRVLETAPISTIASCVDAFTRPGVTTLPVASIRCASPGMAMPAPTATIRPSRIKTVPPSITGPLTGYTLPPVIAIVCAASRGVCVVRATSRSALVVRFTCRLRD